MMIRLWQKRNHGKFDPAGYLLATLLSVLIWVLPAVSTAGGLYLNEFGTPSMGVAGAGANAVASDASTHCMATKLRPR